MVVCRYAMLSVALSCLVWLSKDSVPMHKLSLLSEHCLCPSPLHFLFWSAYTNVPTLLPLFLINSRVDFVEFCGSFLTTAITAAKTTTGVPN